MSNKKVFTRGDITYVSNYIHYDISIYNIVYSTRFFGTALVSLFYVNVPKKSYIFYATLHVLRTANLPSHLTDESSKFCPHFSWLIFVPKKTSCLQADHWIRGYVLERWI